MAKIIDLTGQRFGRLTVLKRGENKPYTQQAVWDCLCDCGNTVSATSQDLRNGHTKSCGCYSKDKLIERSYKHGASTRNNKTRLHRIWCSIKYRTQNPNSHEYNRYGGRGISICKEWDDDFIVFEKWALSHGYQDNLSIDRIDVNGDYEPNNCRWVDDYIQANNKRNNRNVTIDGITHTLKEWCNIKNLSYSMVKDRIHRGWDESQWFIPPVRKSKNNRKGEFVNG